MDAEGQHIVVSLRKESDCIRKRGLMNVSDAGRPFDGQFGNVFTVQALSSAQL